MYANNFSAIESSPNIEDLERNLTESMTWIANWADNNVDLLIAPSKSHITLFTSDPAQSSLAPQVYLGQALLSLEKYPKILGVKWDTYFCFNRHIVAVESKARKRLQILKALAGTS